MQKGLLVVFAIVVVAAARPAEHLDSLVSRLEQDAQRLEEENTCRDRTCHDCVRGQTSANAMKLLGQKIPVDKCIWVASHPSNPEPRCVDATSAEDAEFIGNTNVALFTTHPDKCPEPEPAVEESACAGRSCSTCVHGQASVSMKQMMSSGEKCVWVESKGKCAALDSSSDFTNILHNVNVATFVYHTSQCCEASVCDKCVFGQESNSFADLSKLRESCFWSSEEGCINGRADREPLKRAQFATKVEQCPEPKPRRHHHASAPVHHASAPVHQESAAVHQESAPVNICRETSCADCLTPSGNGCAWVRNFGCQHESEIPFGFNKRMLVKDASKCM